MWYQFAKKQGYESVMVAFYLPVKAAKKMAVDKTDLPDELDVDLSPPKEMHLTLAILGDAKTLEPHFPVVDACLKQLAKDCGPVTGTIGGIGAFTPDGNTPEAEKTHPVYYSFDSPALAPFRQELVKRLWSVGVPVDDSHGYTPHITIGYTNEGTRGTEVLPHVHFKPEEVKFDTIHLRWGNEGRGKYKLGG
ncbi:MAG: 2'-5' RNA ligase family protein [Armatimonadetes bacterium]|nr:2'-5' RNA ligase family protein [Armatimonadota bacterium]